MTNDKLPSTLRHPQGTLSVEFTLRQAKVLLEGYDAELFQGAATPDYAFARHIKNSLTTTIAGLDAMIAAIDQGGPNER